MALESSPRSPPGEDGPSFFVFSSPAVTTARTSFSSHVVPVDRPSHVDAALQQLQRKRGVARASCLPFAFRLEPEYGDAAEGASDGGVLGAGDKLLTLLERWDVRNVLIVCAMVVRGPQEAGGMRKYQLIVNSGKDALQLCYAHTAGGAAGDHAQREQVVGPGSMEAGPEAAELLPMPVAANAHGASRASLPRRGALSPLRRDGAAIAARRRTGTLPMSTTTMDASAVGVPGASRPWRRREVAASRRTAPLTAAEPAAARRAPRRATTAHSRATTGTVGSVSGWDRQGGSSSPAVPPLCLSRAGGTRAHAAAVGLPAPGLRAGSPPRAPLKQPQPVLAPLPPPCRPGSLAKAFRFPSPPPEVLKAAQCVLALALRRQPDSIGWGTCVDELGRADLEDVLIAVDLAALPRRVAACAAGEMQRTWFSAARVRQHCPALAELVFWAVDALEAYFHLVARDPAAVEGLRAHHATCRLPVANGGYGATPEAASLEVSAASKAPR